MSELLSISIYVNPGMILVEDRLASKLSLLLEQKHGDKHSFMCSNVMVGW